MDFIGEIRRLSARIPERLSYIKTEEATKTAFAMPFVRALGYDTEDPTEVVPEFTADFGAKKSDKVDYAIMMNGKPVIVIECKAAHSNLEQDHASQLFQYFAATEARFGILTNGIAYRFYSDLDQRHRMDHRPFLELNMLEPEDGLVEDLKRFTKAAFDVDSAWEAAIDLKYTKEIKRILAEQLREPTDDFVKLFASQIYSGKLTQTVRERFSHFTRDALNQFVNERVDRVVDKAKSSVAAAAADPESEVSQTSETASLTGTTASEQGTDVVTSDDEVQGFYIVRSLLHDLIDVKRVEMRDAKSFCAIHLDHNNRKPICRLWFNRSQKYLGLIDEQKREHKIAIDDLDDIYQYADRLRATVGHYDREQSGNTSE